MLSRLFPPSAALYTSMRYLPPTKIHISIKWQLKFFLLLDNMFYVSMWLYLPFVILIISLKLNSSCFNHTKVNSPVRPFLSPLSQIFTLMLFLCHL